MRLGFRIFKGAVHEYSITDPAHKSSPYVEVSMPASSLEFNDTDDGVTAIEPENELEDIKICCLLYYVLRTDS